MNRSFLAALPLLVLLAPAPASANSAEHSLAPYFEIRGTAGDADPLPLKSTHTDVRIAGVIAQVRITQVYANEGKTPIEAIYVFPASTRAAVSGLRMTIGDRILTAEIETRDLARTRYEEAKSAGKSAALLEQDRPNVFRMNVANILPGDRIAVDLDYSELLAPEGGKYQFVLPAVVGPRYTGTRAADDEPLSDGRQPGDIPYLHQGKTTGSPWAVDVHLSAGLPIHLAQSPSHEIQPRYGDGRAEVAFSLDDPQAGNRDFVLDYWLAGGAIETGLLLSPGAANEENYFLMMVQPPERVVAKDIPGREYVFVVDVSGSMHGFPLDTAKVLMRDLLSSLRPTDSFNVLLFSGGSALLSEKSLPATPENLAKGISHVDAARGGGGTELLPALTRALALPATGSSRTFVVVTDGYVSIEAEAFDLVRKNLDHANLFAFGIGSSVNRYLIEALARAGMGEPFVVLGPAEAGGKASDFREYVSSPVLTSVQVRFDGVKAFDVEPNAAPDLFASRPVLVFGKYTPAPGGRITVSGQTARGKWSKELALADARVVEGPALRQLWARHRIASLEDDLAGRENETIAAEITRLGLAHHLLTSRTSFVAVDEVVRNGKRESKTIRQPLPLPAGVSDRAVGSSGVLHAMGRGTGGSGFGTGMGGVLGGQRGSEAPAKSSGESRASVGPGGDQTLILGTLDPAIIDAVIKRHMAQIKYCYEKELLRSPNLAGKLVVTFKVEADGTVANAKIKSSTLSNASVEACVVGRVLKMRFPAPSGGGDVTVNYPFLFKAAAE